MSILHFFRTKQGRRPRRIRGPISNPELSRIATGSELINPFVSLIYMCVRARIGQRHRKIIKTEAIFDSRKMNLVVRCAVRRVLRANGWSACIGGFCAAILQLRHRHHRGGCSTTARRSDCSTRARRAGCSICGTVAKLELI